MSLQSSHQGLASEHELSQTTRDNLSQKKPPLCAPVDPYFCDRLLITCIVYLCYMTLFASPRARLFLASRYKPRGRQAKCRGQVPLQADGGSWLLSSF